MNWYCIVNGTQRGPMSTDELRALAREGTLKPEEYVWNESFGEQWRRLQDVPELTQPPAVAASALPPELGPDVAPVATPSIATPLTGVPGCRPFFMPAMQQAWDHMLQLLFRSGSFVRWMGLAFCVWISIIGLHEPNLAGEIMLRQAQPDMTLLRDKLEACATPDQAFNLYTEMATQMMEQIRELLTPATVLTTLAVWLVILMLTGWLRARGAFMVMHRWHHPDATIAQSWAAGNGIGQSLFLFRLGFGIVMCVLSAALVFCLQIQVFAPLADGAAYAGALAVRGFLLLLALSLVLTLWITVAILVTHFVVPVMYWRRVNVGAAWRVAMELCNERPGAMTIFFTMYIVLLHVALVALCVGMCCTCCCMTYLLMLPFVNGLLLLPGIIFFRGLGIAFLRQWRPDL